MKFDKLITADPHLVLMFLLIGLADSTSEFWQKLLCYLLGGLFLSLRNKQKVDRYGEAEERENTGTAAGPGHEGGNKEGDMGSL